MKNSTFISVILFVLLFSFKPIFSQNIYNPENQEKETDGYLIYFESEVPQAKIDSIMERFNSSEIWITTYSKVRYWKVNDFPFTIDDSVSIGNIQELFDTWVNDNDEKEESTTHIGSIEYNYKIRKEISDIVLSDEDNYESDQCPEYFDNYNFGNSQIIIDVLDTGFDFINQGTNPIFSNINGQYNFVQNTQFAQDDNGHGTHISSIITSLGGNMQNNINIFESKTHNSQGLGKLSDIVKAIDHSIEIGSNIINASWSYYAKESSNKTPVQIAIETAGEYGILFVTAAGNDAVDNDNDTLKAFPASYDSENILSVSSNACDTSLSYFSNYGFVNSDICAIGENVPGLVLNNQMGLLSGTSQSTAYVSAVAAIVGTHLTEFDPVEVKKIILAGAKHNDNLNGLVKTEAVVDCKASLGLLGDNSISLRDKKPNLSLSGDANEINVYPNPFVNFFNLEMSSERNQKIKVELFDINESIIRSKYYRISKGVNRLRFEISEKLPAGIYYIKSGKFTKKIFKSI